MRKIPNLASILKEKNTCRDHIVMYLFNFKSYGTFLEIGTTDNSTQSGTYLLEREMKWRGCAFENSENKKRIQHYREFRRSPIFHTQHLTSIFERNLLPIDIDYLNINVENPLPILQSIDFRKHNISTISLFTSNSLHDRLMWTQGYSTLVRFGNFQQFVRD